MRIQTLPPHTVRTLGASLALTDVCSIVKELVDNALDARATSIAIEIANNSIDVLQVRDNGHGVPVDGRGLLCRRNCTSKLRDYADVKGVGAASLGFRGQALASAAELAKEMVVTTRVDGESVAASLRIGRDGEIQSQATASHPIGTTIRLANLFGLLPVRKQTALKAAPTCFAKIKHLLQAYAFARPAVRISFKILKAQSTLGDWVYAPKLGATIDIKDTAFKIVGKDCATQCEFRVSENGEYRVEVLLPIKDAELGKITRIGQFVSVDSRPMAATRGVFKKIISIFREALRKIAAEKMHDPFLWLNLVCPEGSYDPNVEPSKDDVLFEDAEVVLATVRAVFHAEYGIVETEEANESVGIRSPLTAPGRINVPSSPPAQMQADFRVDIAEQNEPFDELPPSNYCATRRTDTNIWKPCPNNGTAELDDEDDQLSTLNPWIIAGMRTRQLPHHKPASSIMNSPFRKHNSKYPTSIPFPLPTPAPSSSPQRPVFGELSSGNCLPESTAPSEDATENDGNISSAKKSVGQARPPSRTQLHRIRPPVPSLLLHARQPPSAEPLGVLYETDHSEDMAEGNATSVSPRKPSTRGRGGFRLRYFNSKRRRGRAAPEMQPCLRSSPPFKHLDDVYETGKETPLNPNASMPMADLSSADGVDLASETIPLEHIPAGWELQAISCLTPVITLDKIERMMEKLASACLVRPTPNLLEPTPTKEETRLWEQRTKACLATAL